MIDKTRGIVLHQIKYSDSGIVVQLYTRKFGRLSFLAKGVRNRKTGKQNVFFQPFFILDLVIYHKESREMQSLKEFTVPYNLNGIQSDIKKTSIALFLAEVLASVLREETQNEELFDFLEESIKYFDRADEGSSNFHIAFLSGLSSYLGFEPGLRASENEKYFDMLNGIFLPVPPPHGYYADPEISVILAAFFASSYERIKEIPLAGQMRNKVLETLMEYYALHLPGLRKIRSLEVLREVFT